MAAHAEGLDIARPGLYEAVHERLVDVMSSDLAEKQSEDAPPPRKWSVRWYLQRKDQLVSHGSTLTVHQACFALAWHKMWSGMTEQGMDSLCRLLSAGGLCNEANLMPRFPSTSIWFELRILRCHVSPTQV